MSISIRNLTKEVMQQNDAVPLFRETDVPEHIANMIVEESQELVEELEKAFVTDDLTQVAGEIGDVLYLALKMCDSLGLNADEVLRMKILRNELKYGGQTNQQEAKKQWELRGGDAVFYQMYLELTHHED